MNKIIEDKIIEDIESYTDQELANSWDHLETLKLTPYVDQKMEEINAEIGRRANRTD